MTTNKARLRYIVERITYQNAENGYSVMPVLMTHYVMLQRNLIYTDITRARKICVLVGQAKALAYAIYNQQVLRRNTRLKERLAPSAAGPQEVRTYPLPAADRLMAAEEAARYFFVP